MKKRIILIIFIVMLTINETAYATETINYRECDKTIELGDSDEYNKITYSEFDVLQMLRTKTDTELKSAGYSTEVISQIKGDEFEQELQLKVMERAKMSNEELRNLGYSEEKIVILKSLTGEESLEELSTLGIFATIDCSAKILTHYYKAGTGKTYVIASFSWEWSEGTLVALTDGAAVGWNHDFALDNNVSTTYNKHKITYVNSQDSTDKYTVTNDMVETEVNTSLDKIDVAQYTGKTQYYAMKGSGTVALSQVGKMSNVKFIFKYGHNTIGAAVSLSAPFGVSFGYTNVEETYSSGVKNSDTPIEIN